MTTKKFQIQVLNQIAHTTVDRSKEEMAYTLIDVDRASSRAFIEEALRVRGALAVRYLPMAH